MFSGPKTLDIDAHAWVNRYQIPVKAGSGN
jgi:hypothetical protein